MSVGLEGDNACDARKTREEAQLVALQKQVGRYWLDRKTRYATSAPNIGESVESCVIMCLGCISPEDNEPVGPDCNRALTALDDLAAEVNAAK
jgi:hypothetical protein